MRRMRTVAENAERSGGRILGVISMRELLFVVALALALVAIIAGGGERLATRPAFSSSELTFYERSPSGALIVPASCASADTNPFLGGGGTNYPHWPGNCDVSPGTCTLTASPSSISQGQSSTLSWNTGPPVSPYDFFSYTVVGSIQPGVGDVYPGGGSGFGTLLGGSPQTGGLSPQGSKSVSPSNTTTYTYSGQYKFGLMTIGSFSCSRQITVSGFSCTNSPSNATVCQNDNTGLTQNTSSTLVSSCSSPAGSAPKCEYTCSSGYTKQGSQCVSSCLPPRQLVGGVCQCPAGQNWNGSQCVLECIQQSFCGSSSCVAGGGDYRCSRNADCSVSVLLPPPAQPCQYGCSVATGQCKPAPAPTGDIKATPSLVGQGDTTTITWSSTNATSCTVTATNGDSWTGTSGTRTSKAIVEQTEYRLSCTGPGGNVTDSEIVDIIPVFEET